MKAKTVKEVLIAAKYMLEHIGWHQYNRYNDKNGNPINSLHPEHIVSMCLSVALDLVQASNIALIHQARYFVMSQIMDQANYAGITHFNDTHSKEQVLSFLDKAIEKV